MELMLKGYIPPAGRAITQKDIIDSDTDTAIYVLSRQAGEGGDRKAEKGDMFISEINILKEYQGMGIGTEILTKQLDENKVNGIRTILRVFKDNPAKKLYERLGFSVYDEIETHYLMEKI